MSRQFDTPERMVQRKNDHIAICLGHDVESRGGLGFESLRLKPEALPDFDLEDVESQTHFLGRDFRLPLLITGMTGGVEKGEFINRVLVRAASRFRIPMGLGSQKMMFVQPEYTKLFDLRPIAPEAFLIGNLGLGCFNTGVTLDDVKRMVEEMQLDAIAFHLNALQESIQPEGETGFTGLLGHLEAACKDLGVPVMVKEVGSGIAGLTALRLARAGVDAIDVGGKRGTSWGYIEGQRGSVLDQRLGDLFKNWGLSTVESLIEVVSVLQTSENEASGSTGPRPEIVATGGVRSGLDVAKAVAAGAAMAGVGLPLLRAVLSKGTDEEAALEAVCAELEFFERGLKIAQFVSGCRSLGDLPGALMGGFPDAQPQALEDMSS